MRTLFLVISMSWALLLVSPIACSSDDGLVLVDQSEKAYTYFISVPKEKIAEVESQVAGKDGIVMVSWEIFMEDKQKYMGSKVLKDEYKGSRTEEGIVQLLEKYPGVPFGLTWNGGVAFTYNDYQHAKSTYEKYIEDPDEYEQTRNRDPRADPVKPEWHFGPLLGW